MTEIENCGIHTAKKGHYMILYGFFLFTHCSYTRFPHIPVCIPEFSVLVILATFTYHMFTRTAIYQSQTRIYYIYQLYTNLWKPLFCFLLWADIFLENSVIFLGYCRRHTINMAINTESMCTEVCKLFSHQKT